MAGTKTPAVTALVRAKAAHTIHDLGEEGVPDDGRDYGTAAAEVMDTAPVRVFKTILVPAGGLAEDMAAGIAIARESIDTGKARQALDRLVEVSNA